MGSQHVHSSDTDFSESEEEIDIKVKSKRGIVTYEWSFVRSFDSEQEALEYTQKNSDHIVYFGDLEDYIQSEFSVWKVTLNTKDWLTSTCPAYQKDSLCKHIIGVVSTKKLTTFPPKVKKVSLGQKRKRGRQKRSSS